MSRRISLLAFAVGLAAAIAGSPSGLGPQDGKAGGPRLQEYAVPPGTHPHDVAPARDGGVWYTAQGSGQLGWLDPKSGRTRHVALGSGSAPHGVIVGPDGARGSPTAGSTPSSASILVPAACAASRCPRAPVT